MARAVQNLFGRARFVGTQHLPGRAAAANTNATPHRRALLAKVHLAKKELALSDDDYRAILLDVAGVDSAGACDDRRLVDLLDRFKARGWKPAGRSAKPADHKPATKARALWLSLYHLNAIENASERALEAFARRQLGCDRLQWANQGLMYRLIEALKAMAARHGWDQTLEGVRPEAAPIVLRRRLIRAIHRRLAEVDAVPADWDEERAIREFAGMEMQVILATASELDIAARELGRVLRETKGARR